MKINAGWHEQNRMPKNPNLEQRVKWHLGHTRHCACRPLDEKMVEEFKNRYLNTNREFWIFFNTNDHKVLAGWAADCSEHVLPLFEESCAGDARPRQAIQALREWITTGNFSMSAIRGAALSAHAAARKALKENNKAACFSARAAGQAVATAHVPTHALGAAMYALKAVGNDRQAEREWQIRHTPENMKEWVNSKMQNYLIK